MVENKETETEPESEKDTGKKTVFIDVILNYIRYCGDVEVDKNGNVDLKGIPLSLDSERTACIGSRIVANVVNILKATALATAGEGYDADVKKCHICGWYGFIDEMVVLANGEYAYRELTVEWEGEYFNRDETEEHQLRRGDRSIQWVRAPESFWNSRHYCSSCECYIEYDDDYYGEDECTYCHEERQSNIIEGYSESHDHRPIYFGSYKGDFAGLGFELEVDCDEEDECNNEETAEGLCSACGLEDNEMRFAYDGSLNYGFECISQPHTIKDFWDKQDKWRKMLRYLSNAGYTSHNAGTCGLHVHVSRTMFGRNTEEQDRAISKVYAFFDENWRDLVRVSRRNNLEYCDKNKLCYGDYQDTSKSLYSKWKKAHKGGSHYAALNNGNCNTFEYRLGRGTLNAWSFFAWIDLVLTITKNARRITIDKVTSNDLLAWLGGIKESTAKYIYRRRAFRDAMKALYPAIEWENDLTDND